MLAPQTAHVPDPRLIEFVRLLARRAAREWYEQIADLQPSQIGIPSSCLRCNIRSSNLTRRAIQSKTTNSYAIEIII